MKISEIREALTKQYMVKSKGIFYKYISAVIYRYKKKHLVVSLELQDIRTNSVTIARLQDVEIVRMSDDITEEKENEQDGFK